MRKPKALRNLKLEALLKDLVQALKEMNPFDRALMMMHHQKRSFVSGNIGLSRPDLSREQVDEVVNTLDESILVDSFQEKLKTRDEELAFLKSQNANLQSANEEYRQQAREAERMLKDAESHANDATILTMRLQGFLDAGERVSSQVDIPVSVTADHFINQLSRIADCFGPNLNNGVDRLERLELFVTPADLCHMKDNPKLINYWDQTNAPEHRGKEGYRGTLLGFPVCIDSTSRVSYVSVSS